MWLRTWNSTSHVYHLRVNLMHGRISLPKIRRRAKGNNIGKQIRQKIMSDQMLKKKEEGGRGRMFAVYIRLLV